MREARDFKIIETKSEATWNPRRHCRLGLHVASDCVSFIFQRLSNKRLWKCAAMDKYSINLFFVRTGGSAKANETYFSSFRLSSLRIKRKTPREKNSRWVRTALSKQHKAFFNSKYCNNCICGCSESGKRSSSFKVDLIPSLKIQPIPTANQDRRQATGDRKLF